VCGRWVCEDLLRRLSRRARSSNPPSRRELIEDFCRGANWRDVKGRLRISSASLALQRLEKGGKVQLPAAPARAPRSARRLLDDEQALPPLPELPNHAGKIPGLRLRLIQDERDRAHLVWNRLIGREHPLGGRPLVGAQLRYLVECDLGIVGAFGFGPPAFHLECRDQWIGWNSKARGQNRQRVIGLSRFLIRRGLSCHTLASRCYGLVLKQVAEDWLERYGIKPVLVETYVDRLHHQGRSLAAANWRRLGESKGRGRDDQRRQKSKSPKDVWVYELDKKARLLLQAQEAEVLAPRSVFAATDHANWAAEEMGAVDLGDTRLNERVGRMLQGRWERPGLSFHRSFGSLTEGKRAYELVENERSEINLQSLLAPHQQQTARRMAAEKVVLMAQDTTALSYNGLEATEGLGPIGEDYTRGLFLHSLQVFRLDGIPLGTAWAEVWARPEERKGPHRNKQSVDQKESGRWLRALQEAGQRARQMPRTRLVVCGDRESDFYELYDQKLAMPSNVDLLVRGHHDRCLTDGTRLKASLEKAPLGGTLVVQVPRRKGQPARRAVLELRWLEAEIRSPAVALKKSWPSLKLYAVWAREVGAPAGVEPIEWLLLTTWPVNSLKMARRIVRWYALRWGIECWHKVLKSVCGVERRQLKSAQALERALALDMIVASRILLMNRFGKEHPELPAEILYSPAELEVLQAVKKKKRFQLEKDAEAKKLTVLQANILVAMLAGFWGRKGDGHPGAKILAEGLYILHALVWYTEVLSELDSIPRPRAAPT
jgi:uncharacterized protein DUF4338/transposase-like protein/transposase Tn5 family protein